MHARHLKGSDAVSLEFPIKGMTTHQPTEDDDNDRSTSCYQEENNAINNEFAKAIFRSAIQRQTKNTPLKNLLCTPSQASLERFIPSATKPTPGKSPEV